MTICLFSLTSLPYYILYCSSILSLSAVSNTCEFETINTKRDNIVFPTTCLEAGDRLEVKFSSVVIDTFISQVEKHMQFTRDTAFVTVVQGISVTRYMYISALITELVLLYSYQSAVVGLEKTLYTISSVADEVEVCTVINTTYDNCECQPRSSFNLTITMKGIFNMFMVTSQASPSMLILCFSVCVSVSQSVCQSVSQSACLSL